MNSVIFIQWILFKTAALASKQFDVFAVIKNIKPFRVNQNDVIKYFAVIMSAAIKRVDCTTKRDNKVKYLKVELVHFQ